MCERGGIGILVKGGLLGMRLKLIYTPIIKPFPSFTHIPLLPLLSVDILIRPENQLDILAELYRPEVSIKYYMPQSYVSIKFSMQRIYELSCCLGVDALQFRCNCKCFKG